MSNSAYSCDMLMPLRTLFGSTALLLPLIFQAARTGTGTGLFSWGPCCLSPVPPLCQASAAPVPFRTLLFVAVLALIFQATRTGAGTGLILRVHAV